MQEQERCDDGQPATLLDLIADTEAAEVRLEIVARRRQDVILFRSASFAVSESPRMDRRNAERPGF
jgi:hypothetical protein